MDRPAITLTSVTIGTSMPHRLADFYSALLGMPVTTKQIDDDGEQWAQIRPPADGPPPTPTVNFEYERHYAAPVWPARPGAQNATAHLDLAVQDLPAAVQWAQACGARLAGYQPQEDVRVLFDPDGHPFCLFTT